MKGSAEDGAQSDPRVAVTILHRMRNFSSEVLQTRRGNMALEELDKGTH